MIHPDCNPCKAMCFFCGKAFSSEIRQEGESQNGCHKKIKHIKFSKKRFLPPDTYTYECVSGGKKYSFFGKFDVLCFLVTSVLRFALMLYYRRSIMGNQNNMGTQAAEAMQRPRNIFAQVTSLEKQS